MDSSSVPNPHSNPGADQELTQAYWVRSERERVLEAMLRVTAAKGYEMTTVPEVAAAAGVSEKLFERLFDDKQACFLAAYDAAVDVGAAYVIGAFEGAEGLPWPDRVAAALRALVELFSSESEIIKMAMVEVTAMGEDPRARYRGALVRFEPLFDEGVAYSPQGEALPPDTAGFAVAAATSMIFDEVRAGRGPELPRILPDLVYAVLMPFLGPRAAEEEMLRVAGGD